LGNRSCWMPPRGRCCERCPIDQRRLTAVAVSGAVLSSSLRRHTLLVEPDAATQGILFVAGEPRWVSLSWLPTSPWRWRLAPTALLFYPGRRRRLICQSNFLSRSLSAASRSCAVPWERPRSASPRGHCAPQAICSALGAGLITLSPPRGRLPPNPCSRPAHSTHDQDENDTRAMARLVPVTVAPCAMPSRAALVVVHQCPQIHRRTRSQRLSWLQRPACGGRQLFCCSRGRLRKLATIELRFQFRYAAAQPRVCSSSRSPHSVVLCHEKPPALPATRRKGRKNRHHPSSGRMWATKFTTPTADQIMNATECPTDGSTGHRRSLPAGWIRAAQRPIPPAVVAFVGEGLAVTARMSARGRAQADAQAMRRGWLGESADYNPPAHDFVCAGGFWLPLLLLAASTCRRYTPSATGPDKVKPISLVKSRTGGLGLKREDRPAAFAGRSESQFFWLFCGWIPPLPTQASILSHSRAPSTPASSHPGKKFRDAAEKCVDSFAGKQCDPLQEYRLETA